MDCMDLFPQIPDGFVSLVLTDPPYEFYIRISLQNENIPYSQVTKVLITGNLQGRVTESCMITPLRTSLQGLTVILTISSAWKKAGFSVKNCLVIEKGTVGGIGDLQGSYANNSEWIIFCQKGRRIFNHTALLKNKKKEGTQFHRGREPSKKYKTRFNACWFGEEYPKATYNSPWQKKNQIYHPTIKNVEFLSWLIQISSLPGELVFDGFMGSGSTAVAAVSTGRNYLGAEISRDYYGIIKRRMMEFET